MIGTHCVGESRSLKIVSDDASLISGQKISSVIDLKLSVNPEKANRKVRGDQWMPAKNPLMAKLVFFVVPSIKEVSECLPSCKSVLL